jgi:hypothetical protein
MVTERCAKFDGFGGSSFTRGAQFSPVTHALSDVYSIHHKQFTDLASSMNYVVFRIKPCAL